LLDRGSRVGDVTFGAASAELAVARAVSPRWSVVAGGSYGATVPTLCGSSADCMSSLGQSAMLRAGVRHRWPRFGRFSPAVDGTAGHEWFSSKLSDDDAVSSRHYRGWIGAITASCGLSRSERWIVAPLLDLGIGAFHRFNLETPSFAVSRPVSAVHAWLSLGLRVTLAI
jgi:hypothetical protein